MGLEGALVSEEGVGGKVYVKWSAWVGVSSTNSSFAFPLSLTEKAYDVSRPEVASRRFKKVW
jgi:hypothetical protein